MEAILYPVFVYMYLYLAMQDYWDLAHAFWQAFARDFAQRSNDDLMILQNLPRQHLTESDPFQKYMKNKCIVTISPYGYKLLLHFAQIHMLVILLHIFNLHIEFRLHSDRFAPDPTSAAVLLPYNTAELEKTNKTKLLWGRLPITPEAMALKVGPRLSSPRKLPSPTKATPAPSSSPIPKSPSSTSTCIFSPTRAIDRGTSSGECTTSSPRR
jgi:hypothetical protein